MANLNFNRFEVAGRVAADLELKMTADGVSVLSFPLAVTRRGKGVSRETDFLRMTAWSGTAEFIAKYFKKGSSILVCGEIRARSFESKTGEKRYSVDFVVGEAFFVDSKSETQNENFADQAPNFEQLREDEDLPF